MSTLDEARAVKERAHDVFSKLAPVVGVGITRVDGEYAVKINLLREPNADVHLPVQVDGVPVRVEIVGDVQKR